MSTNQRTEFESFLYKHNDEAWSAAITELINDIHEVDRNATQFWFKFYPLTLWKALGQASDKQELVKKL